MKLIALLLCLVVASAKDPESCVVRVEKDAQSNLVLEDMQLQVFTFPVGVPPKDDNDATILTDTYKCMPDGNCFFVVQDIENFVLKIKGPAGAKFEPEAIKIKYGNSPLDCENLAFLFKGFRLEIPVKTQSLDVKNDALAGYKVKLCSDKIENIEAYTNTRGVAIFDNLQATNTTVFTVELIIPTIVDDDGIKHQEFNLDADPIQTCQLDDLKGFNCSNEFTIVGSLLTGLVKSTTQVQIQLTNLSQASDI